MLVIGRDFGAIDDDDDDVDIDFEDNRSRRRHTKDSSDTVKLLFHAGKPQVPKLRHGSGFYQEARLEFRILICSG
jgi:hypothetical protein